MQNTNSPYRWIILIIATIAYGVVIIHRMSPAVMAESMMIDLQVNAAFMGLLASAYFYPYSALQIPSGILADKVSPKMLIMFSLISMSIGTFVFASAANASIAFVGRLIVGVGCALVMIPSYQALANWFSKKSYPVIISTLLAIAVGLGGMLSGKPLSALIENYGWRIPMQGFCVFTLALAVICFIFFKDTPPESKNLENNDNNEEQEEKLEELSIKEAFKFVIAKRNFWIISFSFTINSAVMFAFVGLWAALYYTKVVGLTQSEMGYLLSMAATLTIVTPILFASVAQKVKSRKNVIIFANALLFLMFVYFILRNGSFNKTEIYAWGLSLSVIVTAPAGIYMATLRGLYPKNIASTANGLAYSLTMAGAAIFQPLIGVILNIYGYVDTLTADMFFPICLLYFISLGFAFVGTFFLQEKDGQLV